MIDDYAANYVWLHKAARDAYTASVPQALETWVDQYHDAVGERMGLRVPMVPRITDEDLDAIQQRYHPEPGYDPALSIVQKFQRSRVDVLIDLGTHAIYVPLPSGAGVVKQSALVDAMRRRLAYVPPPPKPAPLPEPMTIPCCGPCCPALTSCGTGSCVACPMKLSRPSAKRLTSSVRRSVCRR